VQISFREASCRKLKIVKDYEGLFRSLRSGGLTVKRGRGISQPFFSVNGRTLVVEGDHIQVFIYKSKLMADKEAKQIDPSGSPAGTTMITWVAPPHFYKTDRLIVLYVGKNPRVLRALERALGPQFAGR